MLEYRSVQFGRAIRTYLMNVPKKKLRIVVDVVESMVSEGQVPTRILMVVKDVMAYRCTFRCKATAAVKDMKVNKERGYINVLFHNKGMDMFSLQQILNSRRVMTALPSYLRGSPPVVTYTYTRSIAGKIFNNRKVVDDLDMDCGTQNMQCSCSSSEYCYKPCGHVITGNLNVIKDGKLRILIKKGPTYREQNNIDWEVNFKNCREAVSRYTKKWAKDANVDRRVLRDWKEMVVDSVQRRISYLRQRHINKRKKHVLKNKVHLNSLEYMHENFVLVPADKASNNVTIVCKKYYLDGVIRELSLTSTYQEVSRSCDDIAMRHIRYTEQNSIVLQPEHETLPSFYWLPKLHKSPFGKRFIAASNKCTTKRLSPLLTACFKTTLTHYKQYCEGMYKRTGVNCFWVIENSMEVLEKLRRINKLMILPHCILVYHMTC